VLLAWCLGRKLGLLKLSGAGEGNRTLVFSLEVSGFSQCFQEPFRHFAAFWAIEITTEFLFVGMAITTRLSELCWRDDDGSVVRRKLLFS
jgi:hypothetical protein